MRYKSFRDLRYIPSRERCFPTETRKERHDHKTIHTGYRKIFTGCCLGWAIDIFAGGQSDVFQRMAVYGHTFCSDVFCGHRDDVQKPESVKIAP